MHQLASLRGRVAMAVAGLQREMQMVGRSHAARLMIGCNRSITFNYTVAYTKHDQG